MTTRDFIARTYNTTSTKDRSCSSVFTDHNGIVYSYGYHYPLAFNLKGLDFVNNRGYSNTTAKHINWAWSAVGYDAVAVKLWRKDIDEFNRWGITEEERVRVVLDALQREIAELKELADSKKRKDTQVYRSIEQDLHRARVNYMRVKEVL